MGFIIEKSFQEGGKRLRELSDLRIESLARIKSLEVNKVRFEED
jgi:xanthine phosphoribosyltransferase